MQEPLIIRESVSGRSWTSKVFNTVISLDTYQFQNDFGSDERVSLEKIIPKLYLIKPKDVKQTLHHIPPQKYIGFVSSYFLVRGFCKNCQLYDESLFCCSSLLDGCKLLPFLFEIMLQHEKGITDINMSTSLNSSHKKNTVAQRIFTIDITSLGV